MCFVKETIHQERIALLHCIYWCLKLWFRLDVKESYDLMEGLVKIVQCYDYNYDL